MAQQMPSAKRRALFCLAERANWAQTAIQSADMPPGGGGDCASQLATAIFALVDNDVFGCPVMFIVVSRGGSPPLDRDYRRPTLRPV